MALLKMSGNCFLLVGLCPNFALSLTSTYMAKAATKAAPKAAPKSPAKSPKKSGTASKKPSANPTALVEAACVESLMKLQELELDYQLQSEINWCLGSFRNDGNPVGLYMMADRALAIFKTELANKRKGINAKLIKDIEKALKDRE